MKLTPQQEKFAQLIASGVNQSDAYRAAYPNSVKWQPQSVHIKACRLAAKVGLRVEELRAPVIAKVRYDLKQAMTEAERAMTLAEDKEQVGAMVSAVKLRAQLNGLLVEERRNDRRPLEDATDEELDRIIEQAEKEIAASAKLY